MQPLFGIETEYGITVDGKDKLDVVSESIALVGSYTQKEAALKWDYSLEDPYLDARGFRVKELLEDSDEPQSIPAEERSLSWQEIKSDLVLSNGARFYNDHAHPEYSTPECTTLDQIAAHDQAGERILWLSARRRNQEIAPLQVRLYKNNTDFLGHSYGCHDNYLVPREVEFRDLAAGMMPFLVTRQIFAGAGKIGIENENHQMIDRGHYQISQRSDFFCVLLSIDTMRQRPIINTRDEPHADPARYRRFHVIVGDANMNDFATALKIGTTQLALELIEKKLQPAIALADPIHAIQSVSHDPVHRWIVSLADGRTIPAIDLQRLYLAAAQKHLASDSSERIRLLSEWETILDDLESDPWKCADRVDWVAKKSLLQTMVENEAISWNDPWLQSIDLEYHNIDPEQGLFHALQRQGRVRGWIDPARAEEAVLEPPRTSRAYFRGRCVRKFGAEMSSVQWDEVEFLVNGRKHRIDLDGLFCQSEIERYNSLVDKAHTPENLLRELGTIP
jgi:proteasome accessory factor A